MNPHAQAHIRHVVVLMLENNSFDRMLGAMQAGKPELEGINPMRPRSNRADSQTFVQSPYAPGQRALAGLDAGHEYADALAQMGDLDAATGHHPMNGFASDAYDQYPDAPTAQKLSYAQWVMNYFPYTTGPLRDDPLPVLRTLANHYVICDHWFSALPGPTLPNRFFATCGTAFGEVLMPGQPNWGDITLALGILTKSKQEESIFTLCQKNGIKSKVFCSGALPFAAFASGVELPDVGSIKDLEQAAASASLPQFSWIEPDYAFLGGWGDSQHPPADPSLGEALIQRVYEALRTSPQWKNTLLIVNYDENGGFYDHVSPPTAVAPDARNAQRFKRYGPRVPALLISPCLQAGAIDPTVYDHTSVLAFVCDLFGLPRAALRERVRQARHFGEHPTLWCEPDTLNSVVVPPPALIHDGEPPVTRWQALGELLELVLQKHTAGEKMSGVVGAIKIGMAKLLRQLN